MTKVLSLRVGDDLAAWADEEAARQGVSRQDLLVYALAVYRDQGSLRDRVRRVQEAQRRDLAAPKPTREDLDRATRERVELFSRLRAPESARGVKPKSNA